jgi:thymidylate synthase (FAD)
MTEHTIIKPHVEFFEPPDETNYLEFLETCTRVCYKSEDRIKEGSAEKLMTQVVKNYEHYSVTEHANVILQIEFIDDVQATYYKSLIIDLNHMFANRFSYRKNLSTVPHVLISGNIRMWMELIKLTSVRSEHLWGHVQTALHTIMPFFFEKEFNSHAGIEIIDSNPLTNKNNLDAEEMKKHMTATFKLVGNRSMSHQLVRHRLFAFSQESQRYCNYGKKGFQFIVPLSVKANPDANADFIEDAVKAYENYLHQINDYKVKPEDARDLLSNCCKTEVVTTGTLGYWIDHVIPHRAHNEKAQWQIRELCLDAEKILKKRIPKVFK